MSMLNSLLRTPTRRDLMGRLGAASLESACHQQDAADAKRAAADADAELSRTRADRDAIAEHVTLLEMQLGAMRAELEIDPATRLHNKRWLTSMWGSITPSPTGLLVVDVDGLKTVNDRWGHAAGDEVISTVASRLAAHNGHWPVRLTRGDEFAVVITGDAELTPTAAMIGGMIAAPMTIAGVQPLIVTASIGAVAVNGETIDELLHRADIAMYVAKRSVGRPVLWQPGMAIPSADGGNQRGGAR